MRAILNLFASSPFAPLQRHMEEVSICVKSVETILRAFMEERWEDVEKLATEISECEHAADHLKIDIRNHLPKSLFLPIDRGNLLDILELQDSVADKAENIGVLLNFKHFSIPEHLKKSFELLMAKNLECFFATELIIKEMNDLLQSSFGGIEAEKVNRMVEDVAYKEHEADLLQRQLLKALYSMEEEMPIKDFLLFMRLIEVMSSLSDVSEKLAYRVRMTLDLK